MERTRGPDSSFIGIILWNIASDFQSNFEISFLMFLSETGETIEVLDEALKIGAECSSGPGPGNDTNSDEHAR